MNLEKLKMYSPINEEAGVVMIFSKIHSDLGFPKLVSPSARGFDIKNIEYIDDLGTHACTVEFEYYSSNFEAHGHQDLMIDDRKYIVVCWKDDCHLSHRLLEKYNKKLYKVIELYKYVEILNANIDINEPDTHYYLINYNSKNAEYRTFSDWKKSNIYRINISKSTTKIFNNSKALVKQGNYIIGGFDIIRYKNIKLNNSLSEIMLYKDLTDYPVGLFDEQDISQYVSKEVGHIFYTNYFELPDIRLRKTVKELLPDLGISHASVQTLTEEQYNKLLGVI